MNTIKTGNFKILLASENLPFKNNLGSKLRLEGFDAEIVEGGFHLIHLLERFGDYQMIIINGDLKDMSGLETIQLIRILKSKIDLPIIYVAKNGNKDEVYHLAISGANEYIILNPNYKQIIDSVHKHLSQLKTTAA